MIFINGTVEMSEAAQEILLPMIRDAMTETHKEEGCMVYRFTRDLISPTVIHIVELWATEAALKAHMQTPLFLTVVPMLNLHARVVSLTARRGEFEEFDLMLPQ
jgi:quinol monooxygenase YgiN